MKDTYDDQFIQEVRITNAQDKSAPRIKTTINLWQLAGKNNKEPPFISTPGFTGERQSRAKANQA